MRKVKFNRLIERQINPYGKGSGIIEGTDVWQEGYINEGIFTGWGTRTKFTSGMSEVCTVALIEIKDGTVEMVDPGMLKFEKEVTPTEIPIEDLIQVNKQAKYMVAKLGQTGARVQCLQEMRDTSNSEHYRFWCRVNDLIPTI